MLDRQAGAETPCGPGGPIAELDPFQREVGDPAGRDGCFAPGFQRLARLAARQTASYHPRDRHAARGAQRIEPFRLRFQRLQRSGIADLYEQGAARVIETVRPNDAAAANAPCPPGTRPQARMTLKLAADRAR